jgi:hypothetical protein
METLCIMCGKEAEQGGYTARIQEHVLRPLCGDCQRLCSKDPGQVLQEYAHLFASPASSSPPAETSPPFPQHGTATSKSSSSSPLHSNGTFVNRYRDLYRAASLLTGLGTTVKTIGIVVAIVILFFWFIVGIATVSETSSSPFAGTAGFFVCTIIGVVFGALVGGLFFLLGILISAQGQLLMVHADAAVHTSPFLSDMERAAAMSLPYTAPATAGAAAG